MGKKHKKGKKGKQAGYVGTPTTWAFPSGGIMPMSTTADAQKDPRPEDVEAILDMLADRIMTLVEEREEYLEECPSLMGRRRVARIFDEHIQRASADLAKLQSRWAHIKDALNEAPEEAAQRDGIAMRLLEY